MFTKNDLIYAEAGYILVSEKSAGYQLSAEISNVSERLIDINNAVIDGRIIRCGKTLISNHPDYTYAQWKASIIKWRYSYDDQIAILLNKEDSEEDAFYYDKMMDWRKWASIAAKKFVELNNDYYLNKLKK